MILAGANLVRRPCGQTVLQMELIEGALKSSRLCPECGEKGYADIRIFSELLAKEVEKVVSEVSSIYQPGMQTATEVGETFQVKLKLSWAPPQNAELHAVTLVEVD
jgi:hypothetical protein